MHHIMLALPAQQYAVHGCTFEWLSLYFEHAGHWPPVGLDARVLDLAMVYAVQRYRPLSNDS